MWRDDIDRESLETTADLEPVSAEEEFLDSIKQEKGE
jgi:hypothetical protein